jgi:EmrB/QacA subfamily drug resistance transporter
MGRRRDQDASAVFVKLPRPPEPHLPERSDEPQNLTTGTLSRRRLVTTACLMAQFMAAVEGTIVATAMPSIVGELGGFHLFSWAFAAYLLAQAVTTPIYGRLADLYGRKRIFFAGGALFLLGSAACGFAWGMAPLIVFRALQGMGAGAVQPIAWTIIGDLYTGSERARMQGWLSSVWSASAIGGPLLGGFIVEHLHWSLIFWINLPVGLATMAMLGLYLRETVEKRAHEVDYPGALFLIVSVGSLMLVVVQGESLAGSTIAILVAVGAIAVAALVRHERGVAEPIVPYRLWRNRIIAIGNFGSFTIGAMMMGSSGYLPTYIQGAMGRSPTIAGISIAASSVSWTCATILAGRLMIRTSYRLTGVLGGFIVIAGFGLLIAMTPSDGPLWAAGAAAVAGCGMGFSNTTFLVSIQTAVGWADRGAITAGNMFMRTIGQALGAGLFGAILNHGIAMHVPEGGEAVNRLLEPGMRDTLAPEVIARLSAAIASSLHDVYVIGALMACAVLALTSRIPAGVNPVRPSVAAARQATLAEPRLHSSEAE